MKIKKNLFIKLSLVLTLVMSLVTLASCGKKYTVTFDSNGGTPVASVEVKKNKKVAEPVAPTKDSYVFEYWTLNGEKFNFETEIKENITLVAKWKPVISQPAVKPSAPKNVVVTDKTITWDSVTDATEYVVYVNGVSRVVNTTSVNLNELNIPTDAIEVVISIASRNGSAESSVVVATTIRKELSKEEVQKVSQTLQLNEGYSKELLYIIKNKNLSLDETILELNTYYSFASTSSQQEILSHTLEILMSNEVSDSLELILSYYYMQVSKYVEDTINNLNNQIKEIKDSYSEDLMDPSFINRDILYPLLKIHFDSGCNSVQNTLISYLPYASLIGYKVTRDGDKIKFYQNEIKNYTITLSNLDEFLNSKYEDTFMNANLVIDAENAYRFNLLEVLSSNLSSFKETLDSTYLTFKGSVSVNLPVISEYIKNVITKSSTNQEIILAINEVKESFNKMSMGLAQIDDVMNACIKLKDEAVDIMIDVMPTQEQWNAITNIIVGPFNEIFGMEVIIGSNYNNVKVVLDILNFLKTINSTKYDLKKIVDFVLEIVSNPEMPNVSEEKLNEVMQVLMQIGTDLSKVLPKIEFVEVDQNVVYQKVLEILAELEKQGLPILSTYQVIFGKELTKEELVKLNNLISQIVVSLSKFQFNQESIQTIVENIVSLGYVTPKTSIEIANILFDVLDQVLNVELINMLKEYVISASEFIAYQYDIDFEEIIDTISDNLSVVKELVRIWTIDNLGNYILGKKEHFEHTKSTIDKYIALLSNENKYNSLMNIVKMVCSMTGENFEEISVIFDVNQLELLKGLVGKPDSELSEEEENLISIYNSFIPSWHSNVDYFEFKITEDAIYIELKQDMIANNCAIVGISHFFGIKERALYGIATPDINTILGTPNTIVKVVDFSELEYCTLEENTYYYIDVLVVNDFGTSQYRVDITDVFYSIR